MDNRVLQIQNRTCRVYGTVGAEYLHALRTTALARALLRVVGAVFVRVIGLLPQHHAVFHERLVQATSAAVVPTRGGNPCCALLGVDRLGMLGNGRSAFLLRTAT